MSQQDGPSFGDAIAELEKILRGIEGDEVDIDELAEKLGRAKQLLEVCRGKIRKAEVEVGRIVDDLGTESDESDEDE